MGKLWRRINKGNRVIVSLIFMSLIIGLYIGATQFTIVLNPTAADVTYTKIWKDSSGIVIPDIRTATISGKVSCIVQANPPCVREVQNVPIKEMSGLWPITVPYYVKSIVLEVYQKSGADYSTSVYQRFTATASDPNYSTTVKTWGNNWVNAWARTTATIPEEPPFNTMNWTLTLDTIGIPNGEYKFTLKASWTWTPGALLSTSLPYQITATPPSLSASAGTPTLSIFYASFNNGVATGEGGEPETIFGDTDILMVAAILALTGLAVCFLLRRRRRR